MLVPLSRGDVCVCVCVFKISDSEINLRGIRDTSIQSTKGTKKLM